MKRNSLLIDQAIRSIPSEFLRLIEKNKSFAIVSHVQPDADTLGSSLALASLLGRIGHRRKIIIANAGEIPEQLCFLPRLATVLASAKAADLKGFDCGIFLECSSIERAGALGELQSFRESVSIDHHRHGRAFADINWIDPTASSLAEQIYLLYAALSLDLTYEEAICLYAGVVSDTGGFQHSLTRPLTHLVACELLAKKIPHTNIGEILLTQKTVGQLRLLAKALQSLVFLKKGTVAWMELTKKDFESLGKLSSETENIVNFGLSVPETRLSLLLKEDPSRGQDCVSVSFRSRGAIDVSRLAQRFGGGGHFHASGCEFYGKTLTQVRRLLLREIKKIL